MRRQWLVLKRGYCKAISSLVLRPNGFSLVEVAVALGVISIMTLSIAVVMTDAHSSFIRALSKKSTVLDASTLQSALSKGNCSSLITTASGTDFSSSGRTTAQVTSDNTTYADGSMISAAEGASYRVDKVYFDDKNLIGSDAAAKYFSANLYMELSTRKGDVWLSSPRRLLSSITMQVDRASGAVLACNPSSVDRATLCKSISGMTWDPVGATCYQGITQGSNNLFKCPDGMVFSGGACVLSGSGCTYNLLPQHFNDDQVTNCNFLPAGNTVVYPPNYSPPGGIPEQNISPGGNSPGPAPASTAPTVCQCGGSTVPETTSGTTIFCAQARNVGNVIGGLDFAGDLQITVEQCHGGSLTKLTDYYDENSEDQWEGWQPKTCNYQGQNCQ